MIGEPYWLEKLFGVCEAFGVVKRLTTRLFVILRKRQVAVCCSEGTDYLSFL